MHPTHTLSMLALSLALTACGGSPQTGGAPTPPPAESRSAETVAWFDGGVEQAFAQARSEGKPIFLISSATWCPHCRHLEHKILGRPELVAESRGWLAVLLDADGEQAQIWGEKLDTQGYPTVILFDPEGRELYRPASDLPLATYVAVLENVRTRRRPIDEALAAVRGAAAGTADPADLELLAAYSWDQDSRLKIQPGERVATFKSLYDATPAEQAVTKSRLLSLWLVALVQSAPQAPALSEPEAAAARSALAALLADPVLRRASLDTVLAASAAVTQRVAPEPGSARSALADAWEQAARALETDPELTTNDQLGALVSRLDLARLAAGEGGALPAPLVEHVRERVRWAAANVNDAAELQSVLGTLVTVLEQTGLGSEAQTLLESEGPQAAAPYYYASWLAGMRARAGDVQAALAGYRAAYESASGRYTRFRWGTTYLQQLLRLSPDDLATIDAAGRQMLSELLRHGDAFAGANHARLELLAGGLGKWASTPQRAEVVAGLRALVHAECGRFPAAGEDSQQARCRAALTGG